MNRIKEIREYLKLNKNQFAVLLGIKNSQISEYENGTANIGKKMIDRIKEKVPNVVIEAFFDPSKEIIDSGNFKTVSVRDARQTLYKGSSPLKMKLYEGAENSLELHDAARTEGSLSIPVFRNVSSGLPLDVQKMDNLLFPGPDYSDSRFIEVKTDYCADLFLPGDVLMTEYVKSPDSGDITFVHFKKAGSILNEHLGRYLKISDKQFLLEPLNTKCLTKQPYNSRDVQAFYKYLALIRIYDTNKNS